VSAEGEGEGEARDIYKKPEEERTRKSRRKILGFTFKTWLNSSLATTK